MKKFVGLFVFLVFALFQCNYVFAAKASPKAAPSDAPVEMTAPKTNPMKTLTNIDSSPAQTTATGKDQASATKVKPKRRHFRPRPKKIVVDYDKVSKLIEYNYFDQADAILIGAIDRNSKDIEAQALWIISLAKQSKLDPAQSRLDCLLKKYPDNSDLRYAQGLIDYQRTTSSNMVYRNNSPKLLSDALGEFKKSISLDKTNAKAYNAAGVVSLKTGNNKDAASYFNKALAIDKTYSLALDNLGTLDFNDGKFDNAQKKFKQALVYNTQNTAAMYHLAQVAMQKKDYSTALGYLNNALAINDNSPAIYNLMGRSYAAQGNEPAAINSFKQSLAVKPEFILSYSDLADIYEKRGDGNFAIEQLKTALAIDPNYNDAKLKIADISLVNGNYNQAINFYAQLVGVDNYNKAALKGLANSYFAQAQVSSSKALLGSNKNLNEALDSVNKAIEADGNDLELHLAKLKLMKITNQPEPSPADLTKIIKAPSSSILSTVTKGEAYLAMNDYKNAQLSFDAAAKMTTNVQDNLDLTEVLIYHKQYDSAEKLLHQILKINPKNKDALNDLDYIQKCRKCANNYFKSAQYYLKSKNSSLAFEYLSKSLAVNPNNAQAHLLLAQLCEKDKDAPQAVANYKAYLSLYPNPSDAAKIQRKIKSLQNRL